MVHATCATCKHLNEGPVNPQNVRERALECRKYPPSVLIVPVHGGMAPVSVFPAVNESAWCGEHEPMVEIVP